jgi:hypothetical protein
MKRIQTISSLLSISLLASSCISIPHHEVSKLPSTPVNATRKVSLTYTAKQTAGKTENDDAAINVISEEAPSPFLTTAFNSGRFSDVNKGQGGDVHVDVKFLNYGNRNLAALSGLITGFSMLTIPGGAADHYKLTATARTASGKSRQYTVKDGATIVIWLPFIVALPFTSPLKAHEQVQQNMYRHLFQDMEKDGLLPKTK